MITFIVLAIYIMGVYIAYFQIQKWSDEEVTEKDEYQVLFSVSLLSWLIYPIYGIMWLIRKTKKG